MGSENQTAVAVRDSGAVQLGIAINNMDTLKAFGLELSKSGMLGAITPSQATVSMIAMHEENLSITTFRRKYQWVGDELSMRPNWLLGEFKRNGGKYEIKQADDEACEITFTPVDGSPYTVRITLEKMIAIGVATKSDGKTLKDNWRKFPDDMLFARVCGKGLRRVAPELMGGVYTDGEAMDFDGQAKPVVQKVEAAEIKTRIEKKAASSTAKKPAAKKQDAEVVEAEIVVDQKNETPVREQAASPSEDAADQQNDEGEILAKLGIAQEDAEMTVPIKGKFFGMTFGKMAVETPDLVAALMTCNRSAHPELTNEHVAALERISAAITNSALPF